MTIAYCVPAWTGTGPTRSSVTHAPSPTTLVGRVVPRTLPVGMPVASTEWISAVAVVTLNVAPRKRAIESRVPDIPAVKV
jgi:hypothetical protein